MSTALNNHQLEGEAGLLVEFLNTADLEEESDSIGSPGGLVAWIDHHLGDQVPQPDEEGHERVLALRESLRALFRANNHGPVPSDEDSAPLRQAAERSRYRTGISDEGLLSLEPARSDLGGFEARLLLALERVQSHGAWPRLKACTEESCQWAFYDATRNRSRTWCSMEECGNRAKTRRYRAKRGRSSSS